MHVASHSGLRSRARNEKLLSKHNQNNSAVNNTPFDSNRYTNGYTNAVIESGGNMTPTTSVGDSLRDRTGEFRAAVDRLSKSKSGSMMTALAQPSSSSSSGSESSRLQQKAFAAKASRIGMSIHTTSQKLQKLAQLAKRTSMFDDPTQQINELTVVIKQDITNMNNDIAELQTLNSSGNKQSNDHSNNVVTNLKDRLMDTTKEFKDVLTTRTESLKVHESRQAMFTSTEMRNSFNHAGPSSSVGYGAYSSPSNTNASQQPVLFSSAARVSESPSTNNGYNPYSNAVATQEQSQMLIPREDTYMNSRAQALQQVESTISELGGMFQQLATMVQQQQEVAIRIDNDVDDTMANVDGAQAQLLKYLDRISGNRWLVLKIFFVLMAFITFFVLFVA